MTDLSTLPACSHRGKPVGDDSVRCQSNRLRHALGGIAPIETCVMCPYINRPNLTNEELQRFRPAAVEPVDLACPHRSLKPIREGRCDQCGYEKGQPFEIFACDLHGECSLHKRHSAVKGCAACEDRTRPE